MNIFKGKIKYIIISIIIIILIVVTILLIHSNNDNVGNITNFSDIIDNTKYDEKEVILSNNTIFDKYDISSGSIREFNDTVKFGQYDGKMLYVRSDKMNANVFQIKNRIAVTNDNHAPLLAQVDTYLTIFKNQALKYLKLNKDSKPIEEKISGDTKSNLPLVEQIYIEKRTYSLTYKVDNVLYDINFYMNDDNFVCEIVRFL